MLHKKSDVHQIVAKKDLIQKQHTEWRDTYLGGFL